MNNSHPARVQPGTPSGGQFTIDIRRESDEQFGGSSIAIPLAELAIPMGTALQIDDCDSGSNLFSGIEVTPSRDQPGFDVVGFVPLDFRGGLCDGMSERHSDEYLNARSTQIEAYLADTYDAGLEGGDSWDDQSATFVAQLPVEARTDQLVESLEVSTQAVDLHHDANGAGFYRALRAHLDEQDRMQQSATAGIADKLGIAADERITDHHPDFRRIASTAWIVQGTDDYDDVIEHSIGIFHHLPSGRLVGAETAGSVSDYDSDGPGDPHGSDLFEVTAVDQLARFGGDVHAQVGQHLSEVPVVDDAAHLTPARIGQRLAAGLPRGVTVLPGGIGFATADFDHEAPGVRGPAASAVKLSASLRNGKISYSAHVDGGIVTIARSNAFGATTRGRVPLPDTTPAGVGRAITEALAQSDRKEQQRAALFGGLRSQLPISHEPSFTEHADGSVQMTVPVTRRGTPGQSSTPRSFGVTLTPAGQLTVVKNSLTPGAAPLGIRTTRIPAGSGPAAAADGIVAAIQDLKS